ncbi:hypothetical protein D1007_35933 [Hordeum vulgare]|nr:hypothetical protein D1007_35933 [Hordeum vulgare]
METRLEIMEQQVFKCQGMVERGLNANHMMIMEFTNKHRIDANDIGKHLSRLYDRVDQLQGQIYDLQNQKCEYEYRFKSIRFASVDITNYPNVLKTLGLACEKLVDIHSHYRFWGGKKDKDSLVYLVMAIIKPYYRDMRAMFEENKHAWHKA